MRFKFRLEAIERIRASYERREKLRLMLATAHLAEIGRRITGLDAEQRAARAKLEAQLEAGLRGGELHFYAVQAEAREAQRRELARQAKDAERQAQTQQLAYTRARRGHEIIQSLRQRAWSLYHVAERRREQQQLDEMFLQARLNQPPS